MTHGDPQVTIQYIAGCPNRALARDRVGVALARRGIDPSAVILQLVETAADAERLGFRGSPTILIDAAPGCGTPR